MNERGMQERVGGSAGNDRAAVARAILVEATPEVLQRAVAAVVALLGGPHCAVDGRPADEWVLLSVADLLADGRLLAPGLPLWVALRDRAAERIEARRPPATTSATAEFRALERRVIARMVPQRLDLTAERVLGALNDGTIRTEEIAMALGLSVAEVIASRRSIARTAHDVAAELRGDPRRASCKGASAVRKPPMWLYVDIDRLAEAIDRERTQARPVTSADEPSAAELFAVVRRSAGLHARIEPMRSAAVARMTRGELRRVLGPIVDVLDDDALRRHAMKVLAGGEGLAMKN